jgi:YVTN family beta-propeller protein
MCITDARARVFVAGGGDSYVAAFDGKSDRRVGMWTSWSYTMVIHADAVADKLYCLSYPSQVIVVDAATNRRVAGISVADYPAAVCFNTVDRKVYVACENEEGGALEVLDGVGDSLLTEVDVEGALTLMAFNPHDDILYAADPGSHWILAIGGKTDSVLDSMDVFERPVGLVYSLAQRKLYSIGADSAVTAIKPDLSGVICRIRVAEDLSLFTSSPTGTRLYCGNDELTWVYVIDCEQDRLACAVPVVSPPVSLCYDSRNEMLYSAGYSGKVSVIDCAKNSLADTVPVSADAIYADSATDAIYCLSGHDLVVVDGKTRSVMRTFDLETYASGLASATGWQYVYLADEGDPYLLPIHKASGPTEMAVRATPDAQATVVRGRLNWTGTLAVMYDMGGRRVGDVHRGGNDVSALRPGVYFVRRNGVRRGTYARKVIITR